MTSSQAVVCFGAFALLLFAAVYFFYDRRAHKSGTTERGPLGGRPFNITFARLFGLLSVAVLGVALAFSKGTNKELAASAFTLLGTVAGYLAGAKATTTAAQVGGPAPGGEAPDGSASGPTTLVQEHL